MWRRYPLFRVLIGSIIFACPARLYAAGLRVYQIGAPDIGVASAGQAASALDASTVFTNPAGMLRLKRPEILIGPQALITNIRFDPSAQTTTAGGDGGNAGEIAPSLGLYFATPLSDEWRLGVSLNSYAAGVVDYDNNWVGRYLAVKSSFVTLQPQRCRGVRAYRVHLSRSGGQRHVRKIELRNGD